MKQGQFDTVQRHSPRRVHTSNLAKSKVRRQSDRPGVLDQRVNQEPGSWLSAERHLNVLMLWYAFTWPFRRLFRTVARIGRLSLTVLGYCLMVIGIAVGTGSFVWPGILVFLLGLIMTLKCLE